MPGRVWGFRHAIGVPVSLGDAAEVAGTIVVRDRPRVLIALSMDPALQQRDDHVDRLRRIVQDEACVVARSRDEAIDQMRRGSQHLVYFYCHGGVDGQGRPFIRVGAPKDPAIARSTLSTYGIRWASTRPLVFVNGCHTADVEPERAVEMISGFLDTGHASGVVGTEITVFEPLATEFAELALTEFFAGVPLGEAVRRARVTILGRDLNPLGLVYIPFALASLALVRDK